jgi:phage shock protein PspC (stress-responsive transcriptional regulator)
MVKNQIPITAAKQHLPDRSICAGDPDGASGSAGREGSASMWDVQKRYIRLALILAVMLGGPLMAMGQRSLGKGIILGTLFAVVNFILMALALPMRLRYVRKKALLFALSSIYVRLALMALPLIWALKHDSVALATTAAGLFMIQIAIFGDHLWTKLRDSMG